MPARRLDCSHTEIKNSIIHHTVNCLKNSKWKFLSVNKLQNRWLKEHVNLRDNVLLMPSRLNMLPFPVAKNQVFHKKNKFRLLHSLHFFAYNKSIVRRVYIGDSKCGKWSIVRGLVQGIKKFDTLTWTSDRNTPTKGHTTVKRQDKQDCRRIRTSNICRPLQRSRQSSEHPVSHRRQRRRGCRGRDPQYLTSRVVLCWRPPNILTSVLFFPFSRTSIKFIISVLSASVHSGE